MSSDTLATVTDMQPSWATPFAATSTSEMVVTYVRCPDDGFEPHETETPKHCSLLS
jgi:hypothetical protein